MSVKSVLIKRDVTPGLTHPAVSGSDVRTSSVAAVILCTLLFQQNRPKAALLKWELTP